MKPKFTVLLLTTFLNLSVSHDLLSQISSVVPPSSSSMQLITSIQNPIDHAMGVVSIQIPLYTLSSGDLQLPISLNYQTSGIRISDRPGFTGIGWRLSAGGCITRIVKGHPDNLSSSVYTSGNMLDISRQLFNSIPSKYKYYNGDIDTEPDLFFYEVPGYSGMFVLNGSTGVTIPYQPLNIKVIEGKYFQIKDQNGNRYIFGGSQVGSTESTTVNFSNDNYSCPEDKYTYTSTWHLMSMEDYKGNKILFNYTQGGVENRTETVYTYAYTRPKNMKESTDETTISTTMGNLSEIIAFDATATFHPVNYDSNRLSEIRYTGDFINTTVFNYESFANGRTFLKKLQQKTPEGEINDICSFSYNKRIVLPEYTSMDYDHWGYYNGAGNRVHRPTYGNSECPETYNSGADRNFNPIYAQACILTAINYPTGGKTEYKYEPHDIRYSRDNPPVGGLRTAEITQYDPLTKKTGITRYEYRDGDGSSGLSTKDVKWGYTADDARYNMGGMYPYYVFSRPISDLYEINGSTVSYSKVTEIMPDGSRNMYEYTQPYLFYSDSDPVYSDEKPVKRFYSNVLDGLLDTWTTNIAEISLPKTSRHWRRNLLKYITKTDHIGNVIAQTEYVYKLDLPNTSVVDAFMPFITFSEIASYTNICHYKWESQPIYLEKVISKATAYNPHNEVLYYYDTHNKMALKREVAKDCEGNELETEYRYPYDLYRRPGQPDTPIETLRTLGIIVPVETIKYMNSKLVSAELIECDYTDSHTGGQKVMPVKRYYLPLQRPATDFTPADYNEASVLIRDSRYKLGESYQYDKYGNIESIVTPEGNVTSIIYGCYVGGANGTVRSGRKIAEVSNALYSSGRQRINQVFYEGFECRNDIGYLTDKAKSGSRVFREGVYSVDLSNFAEGNYILTYWRSADSGGNWNMEREEFKLVSSMLSKSISHNSNWIDEIRILPAGATMTTFAYPKGSGTASQTDHNGITVYTQYDAFGRIKRVLNNERRVVSEYEYNTSRLR